jgi:hypothetical protein
MPSTEWADSVAKKISQSMVFLVIISKNSIESKHVKREIYYAISKDIPIIAFYKEDVELPEGLDMQLGMPQAILAFKNTKQAIYNLPNQLPKNVLGEVGKLIYKYSNYEYRFVPNIHGFSVVAIDLKTHEKRTLFKKNISTAFDVSVGLHSVNPAIPLEFHEYKKSVLFFQVFCDLTHDMGIYTNDLFVNYNFAIVDPNSDNNKLVLEKCMVKKQIDIYPEGLDLANEYFIKNDL